MPMATRGSQKHQQVLVLCSAWTKGFLEPLLILFRFMGKKQIAPEKMKFCGPVASGRAAASPLTSAFSEL